LSHGDKHLRVVARTRVARSRALFLASRRILCERGWGSWVLHAPRVWANGRAPFGWVHSSRQVWGPYELPATNTARSSHGPFFKMRTARTRLKGPSRSRSEHSLDAFPAGAPARPLGSLCGHVRETSVIRPARNQQEAFKDSFSGSSESVVDGKAPHHRHPKDTHHDHQDRQPDQHQDPYRSPKPRL
jgi:hypothetical protein